MALQMARPVSRPNTRNHHFRIRIPADVLTRARGRTLAIPVGETVLTKVIGASAAEITGSLGTPDAAQAKHRQSQVHAYLSAFWQTLRLGPQSLTVRQVQALAKEVYLEFKALGDESPIGREPRAIWKAFRTTGEKILEQAALDASAEPLSIKPGMVRLEEWFGPTVDAKLAQKQIICDADSRQALIEEVAKVLVEGAKEVERNLAGDYATPAKATLLPSWQEVGGVKLTAKPVTGDALTLTSVFDKWARETKSRPLTVKQWRSNMDAFEKSLGHDDVRMITKADVVKWKDALVEKGLASKTINESKLASINTVLNYAVDNGLITENPAKNVKAKGAYKATRKMDGFSNEQAKAILTAAKQEKTPLRRWVPFLCASSGARVAEITQLQKSDIRQVDGVWIMDIDDAGEGAIVKNKHSIRQVPIHQSIIDGGFLEFANKAKAGPLFYRVDPSRASVVPPQKIAANRVRDFVIGLKIEGIGQAKGIAPSHGWRHWFKTTGREAGVQDSVLDALTGHAPVNEGGNYGNAGSLEFRKLCIDKITLPVRP